MHKKWVSVVMKKKLKAFLSFVEFFIDNYFYTSYSIILLIIKSEEGVYCYIINI